MADAKLVDAYVIAKAGEKLFKEAVHRLGGEMRDEMQADSSRQKESVLGGQPVKVTRKNGRTVMDGFGPEFLAFMEERGMTTVAVREEWKQMADPADDGRLVWRETGEVVPGASWHTGSEFVAVSGLSDPAAVIADARDRGLLGAAMPLLEGGTDGD